MTPRSSAAATSPRSREEKYDERRNQLAESALTTLGERGYARTSLREIAQNSEFSHGVVHYYFENKIELITYCVRYYKTTCVSRYDDLLATAATADDLARGFTDKLAQTITDEAPMHRLWYDLRTQSMFEAELREAVLEIDHELELMIWRIVRRYADLRRGEPVFSSPTTYALYDGLFEQALLAHLSGDDVALEDLRSRALAVTESIVR